MKTRKEDTHPFIAHLASIMKSENRGDIAALRRGLGKPPGSVSSMYPIVVPYLPKSISRAEEDAYYLIASLFASHTDPGGIGDMGSHFEELHKAANSDSIEKRFVALLNTNRDDLYNHLRHAIGLLKSKDIPVDWNCLFKDILWWNHEDRFVQRRWAASYWKNQPEKINESKNK